MKVQHFVRLEFVATFKHDRVIVTSLVENPLHQFNSLQFNKWSESVDSF